MKRKTWSTRAITTALVLVILAGATAATGSQGSGSQGSQDDPLVTLSYLNDQLLPDIMKKVDAKVAAKGKELQASVGQVSPQSFVSTEVAPGKTLRLQAGTQLLLRAGTASCSDGLVDLTAGETLGGTLQSNHLYIATKDGQAVTVSEKATFFVLGSSTVK